MITKRALLVWIFASLTFLSILSAFSNAVLLTNEGAGASVSPYILGDLFGAQSVDIFLWLSIATTFIFLGITCIIIYMKQPPDPEIIKLLLKVGGNLAALRKTQESSVAEIADQIEYGRKVNQKFFSTVTSDLKEDKQELLTTLETQQKAVKKVRSDVLSAIETKSTETGEKLSVDLKKQESALMSLKRLSEESAENLKKQQEELDEIRQKLEGIECNIGPNQANLKSLDNPEDIKGIGPALGKELRTIGITSVGEFLTTDPDIIGDNTRVSKEMAENLQATAQLMMIPGIDANDAELLIDAGIKTRKQLADQDLIQLSRKVNAFAKIYIDQGKISKDQVPTIEEIASWIRNAK